MKQICAMCGRPTMPFVMIGREAVGPRCARKAGLVPSKAPKGTRMRFVREKATPQPKGHETLDLFADIEGELA